MRVINSSNLGLAIRERRKELGWSQQVLADKARVSRAWISQLEKGKDSAELGLVLRAIRVLNLQVVLQNTPQSGEGELDGLLQGLTEPLGER